MNELQCFYLNKIIVWPFNFSVIYTWKIIFQYFRFCNENKYSVKLILTTASNIWFLQNQNICWLLCFCLFHGYRSEFMSEHSKKQIDTKCGYIKAIYSTLLRNIYIHNIISDYSIKKYIITEKVICRNIDDLV